ncbi:transmembrane protein 256 homolog [Oppia nitens]|uniref:transmembrane protein 256 homolog n=1 Tax=Oppia nitens TaxID=1686743 RepID=UPI0023DCAEFF|nr:transmembrane protein 256 homolog [Oppia nitens]
MDTAILYPLVGSIWVRLAGVFGALAVGLGAYGAHVVHGDKDLSPHVKTIYDTGNRYHLIHSLVLLAIPLVAHPCLSGTLITIGMSLFSGACYLHVFTGNKDVTRFAPIGGITLMIGWLSMAYS